MEYMGMAGCWREACDVGAMISMGCQSVLDNILGFYIVYRHAYAAIVLSGFRLLVKYNKSRDVVQDDVVYRMAGSK